MNSDRNLGPISMRGTFVYLPLAVLLVGTLSISCSRNDRQSHPTGGGVDAARSDAAAPERTTAPPSPVGQMPRSHDGVIHGTKGDDVLYGTEAGERIEGLAGRDHITAGGGDDVLDGGAENDVLMGGLGNDTYVLQHHGGGADVIIEEGGTDTIQVVGGHVALADLEILRHGDDLLIRYHAHPADGVLIRSWFLDAKYRVERLLLPDGTVVALAPLANQARQASSEDLVHFGPAPQGQPLPPR